MQIKNGFTLIELSIVLVIIGLIVGGVLVGQDLIKAAGIRSAIGEKERYQTATNTFRIKYNSLPGDMRANMAAQFGFESRSGSLGSGDGNRKIESPSPYRAIHFCGEHRLFWDDLASAKLIRHDLTSNTSACPTANIEGNDVASVIPASSGIKLCKWLISESHLDRSNHLFLAGVDLIEGTNGATLVQACLTPSDAYIIDQKIDDGRPVTGSIFGVRDTATASFSGLQFYASAFSTANPSSGDCVDSNGGAGGSEIYATNSDDAKDAIACGMSFRFQ